jgi:hypothetical protein
MTKLRATLTMALALAAMLGVAAAPALAHDDKSGGKGGNWHSGGQWHGGSGWHGHGHGHFHGCWGCGGFVGGVYVDPYWWGYPYAGDYAYGYPPDTYPGPDDDEAGPPQAGPGGPPPQNFWYFCRSSNAYYPYASSCPEAWQRVPTTPPDQGNEPMPSSSQAPMAAPAISTTTLSIPSQDDATRALHASQGAQAPQP